MLRDLTRALQAVVYRGAMGKRQGRRGHARTEKPPEVRMWSSPYGPLRLVARSVTMPAGNTFRVWDLDPDEMRKLPEGSVKGDISRQVFGLGGGKMFYVDEERVCRTCGEEFVFRATEQQYWYETLQFWQDSVAIRCVTCRREVRQGRAADMHHMEVVSAAHARPRDARGQLALAMSICGLRERSGAGDVEVGIGAARRALRLDRALVEALFWEGKLHALAGRQARARATFVTFMKRAATVARRPIPELVREARKLVGQQGSGEGGSAGEDGSQGEGGSAGGGAGEERA